MFCDLFFLGENIDFDEINDVHIPAVALKTFLRDLQEPLLTYDLYQPVAAHFCVHTCCNIKIKLY
jgi:hypothetical protein